MAALLRDFAGLKTGDRVTLHMPMIPELPVTMLACARLGVVHSVVFGGFSGEACGRRIADSGSEVLITADGYYRNGELVDHKSATVETRLESPRVKGKKWTRFSSGGVDRGKTLPRRPWSRGATTLWTRF